MWENGFTPQNPDGSIPSRFELSLTPYAVDSAPPQDFNPITPQYSSKPYLSYNYFNQHSYSTPPLVYIKSATPENEKNSRFFGWNYYITQEDSFIILIDEPPYYQPSAVRIVAISEHDNGIYQITWEQSTDLDNDLLGYRVYIGAKSRGWVYEYSGSPADIAEYIHTDWEPEMYRNINTVPPSEYGIIKTEDTSVYIQVPPGEVRYITIMPFDSHGESVGRQLYYFSDEVIIGDF